MLKTRDHHCIDPKLSAERQQVERGVVPLNSLNLPEDILATEDGDLNYSLSFSIDLERLVCIEGRVEGNLALRCQRCLKPIQHHLCSLFKLSPVSSDTEAVNLPSHYEAVFMENEKVSIFKIVEEEVILNLPIAPLHEGECQSLKSFKEVI